MVTKNPTLPPKLHKLMTNTFTSWKEVDEKESLENSVIHLLNSRGELELKMKNTIAITNAKARKLQQNTLLLSASLTLIVIVWIFLFPPAFTESGTVAVTLFILLLGFSWLPAWIGHTKAEKLRKTCGDNRDLKRAIHAFDVKVTKFILESEQ
ncbi:hypothetical protein K8I28_15160 [bacterium]|nr:hypothetical protein [bacterium]